ncbi:MAG: hypothetical protein QOK28_1579 [Actinomycetota bacterium]|jgi:hypothetical protein
MVGRWRAFFVLVLAVFAASCGAPSFTSRNAASERHSLPRTDLGESVTTAPPRIDDAAVLDRSTTTAAATDSVPGVSSRVVDGVQLVLQTTETSTFRQGTAVHLVLSITNKTGRAVGYLTNRETHFSLVDQNNRVLWTDEQCRAKDTYNTVPTGYLEIAPGDHVSIDDYYPTHPGTANADCRAPAGHAYLTGGVTLCLNLAADDTCRGASDERVQATPIAVTVS